MQLNCPSADDRDSRLSTYKDDRLNGFRLITYCRGHHALLRNSRRASPVKKGHCVMLVLNCALGTQYTLVNRFLENPVITKIRKITALVTRSTYLLTSPNSKPCFSWVAAEKRLTFSGYSNPTDVSTETFSYSSLELRTATQYVFATALSQPVSTQCLMGKYSSTK